MKKLFSLVLLAALSTSLFAAAPRYALQGQRLVSTAADDVVLAYFDEPFDLADASVEFRSFVQTYEMATPLLEKGERPFLRASEAATDSVGPLLGKIMYDQGAPYNNQCPIIGGAHAVTGCVATAMAQVMRYYKYPAVGVGSSVYTGTNGAVTFNYPDHPFDWVNILPNYSVVNYNAIQGDAVANLMLACGAAVNMHYDKDGSGSRLANAHRGMKENFLYKEAELTQLPGAPDPDLVEAYVDLFVEEFQAGRPILYASCPNSTSGHAFVLDGYKVVNGLTYLHVNWGWSGHGNGWFLFTDMRSEPGGPNYGSYDIEFVWNLFPEGWTALEDVETVAPAAVKRMENGLLIIEKSGRRFNALGQEL